MIASGLIFAASLLAQDPWTDVQIGDWNYVGTSPDGELVSLTRPFPTRRNRLWVRWEFSPSRLGPNGERSARQLVEFDCTEGRLRTLQSEGFRDANLSGATVRNALNPDWVYVAPGTFNEQHLTEVCGS